VPCTYDSCRDGDTAVVRVRTGQKLAVRLLDCWAPELCDPGGVDARAHLATILEQAQRLVLHVPLVEDRDSDGVLSVAELLHAFSFDRVLGRLFADGRDVSELMVAAGHATAAKEDAK
jgi:endonuclease YncB( thermonuclease family)